MILLLCLIIWNPPFHGNCFFFFQICNKVLSYANGPGFHRLAVKGEEDDWRAIQRVTCLPFLSSYCVLESEFQITHTGGSLEVWNSCSNRPHLPKCCPSWKVKSLWTSSPRREGACQLFSQSVVFTLILRSDTELRKSSIIVRNFIFWAWIECGSWAIGPFTFTFSFSHYYFPIFTFTLILSLSHMYFNTFTLSLSQLHTFTLLKTEKPTVEMTLEFGRSDLGPTSSMEFISRATLPTCSGEDDWKHYPFFYKIIFCCSHAACIGPHSREDCRERT